MGSGKGTSKRVNSSDPNLYYDNYEVGEVLGLDKPSNRTYQLGVGELKILSNNHHFTQKLDGHEYWTHKIVSKYSDKGSITIINNETAGSSQVFIKPMIGLSLVGREIKNEINLSTKDFYNGLTKSFKKNKNDISYTLLNRKDHKLGKRELWLRRSKAGSFQIEYKVIPKAEGMISEITTLFVLNKTDAKRILALMSSLKYYEEIILHKMYTEPEKIKKRIEERQKELTDNMKNQINQDVNF